MNDQEFDERIRSAVCGIADQAPQPHPFPDPDGSVAHRNGGRVDRGWMGGRRRLALGAATAAVLLIGGWMLAVADRADRPVDVEATDAETVAVPDSDTSLGGDTATSDTSLGGGSGWPETTPGAELIPVGSLEPSWFIFGPGEEASSLAEDYLADRLPDLASMPDGLDIEEIEGIETTNRHAVFGWSYNIADVQAAGWLYLLRADGSWWVVAATTEGVDARRVDHGSQGLSGLVTYTGSEQLALDLVDVETGEPFDPITGEALPPGATGRQLGTAGLSEPSGDTATLEINTSVGREQFAIRVQAVGGTVLTITEFMVDQEIAETDLTMFVEPTKVDAVAAALEADARTAGYQLRSAANTRADYGRLFSDTLEVAEIWDDAAELESISIALATTDPPTLVIEDLLQIDGVLAVVPTPLPSGVPEVEQQADGLVVGTQTVSFRPTAITCEAPIGIEAPPNRFVEVDVSLSAETSEAALARYLAEAPEPPPWPTGYTKLVSTDGSVAFGYADEPDRYLGIVRVEEGDEGWAVIEVEIVGC